MSDIMDIGVEQQAKIVCLGTAAGRSWSLGTPRAGISTALVVDDAIYLVDVGRGWGTQFFRSGLGGSVKGAAFQNLRSIFITHMHADHIIGLPALLTFGLSDGLMALEQPIRIIGPGRRPTLTPVRIPRDEVPVISPADPTPGIRKTFERMAAAFSTDLNDNIRDSGRIDPRSAFDVTDIELPQRLALTCDDVPAPEMDPLLVYSDPLVTVRAVLVDHAPMFPAYAFRFDTEYGSVVFSGDTAPCRNLIRLSEGAKVLVHEVIDPDWAMGLFPEPRTDPQRAKLAHLLDSHTAVNDVGAIAQESGVETLLLTHLAPPDTPSERWLGAVNGFSGEVLVAEELLEVPLGTR